MPSHRSKRKSNTYSMMGKTIELGNSFGSEASSSYHNEGMEDEDEEIKARREERRMRRELAESQEAEKLETILRLQEDYERQHRVEETKSDVDSALEETTSENSSECGYPPSKPYGNRLAWVDSITSSLNSSYNSHYFMRDEQKVDSELKVEGRIKTEELVTKVHEALRKIQEKPAVCHTSGNEVTDHICQVKRPNADYTNIPIIKVEDLSAVRPTQLSLVPLQIEHPHLQYMTVTPLSITSVDEILTPDEAKELSECLTRAASVDDLNQDVAVTSGAESTGSERFPGKSIRPNSLTTSLSCSYSSRSSPVTPYIHTPIIGVIENTPQITLSEDNLTKAHEPESLELETLERILSQQVEVTPIVREKSQDDSKNETNKGGAMEVLKIKTVKTRSKGHRQNCCRIS